MENLLKPCNDCNMSLKIHFLHSYFDFFPQNLDVTIFFLEENIQSILQIQSIYVWLVRRTWLISLKKEVIYLWASLVGMSDKHGERFHQDISSMEKRYQRIWSTSMIADYCWTLKRDVPDAKYSRKSFMTTFCFKKHLVWTQQQSVTFLFE